MKNIQHRVLKNPDVAVEPDVNRTINTQKNVFCPPPDCKPMFWLWWVPLMENMKPRTSRGSGSGLKDEG